LPLRLLRMPVEFLIGGIRPVDQTEVIQRLDVISKVITDRAKS
jgi:hypothetical protein